MIHKVHHLCLELTNHCNFNCDFCANSWMTRKKGFMDPALAKRLISEAAEHNFCNKIALNVMGEPFLHEGLFEILAHCEKLNQKVLLISNGSLLSRDTALRLFEHPPDLLVISYHAGSEHSFKFRNAGMSYAQYKQMIFDFIELKYQMNVRMPIEIDTMTTLYLPHNRFKILDSLDECKQFEKDWLDFSRAVNKKYRLRHKVPFSLLPGMNHLLDGLTLSWALKYHYWANSMCPSETQVIPPKSYCCGCFLWECDVLWNGDVVPCPMDYNGELVYANVTRQSIIEAVNSAPGEDFRNSFVKGENVPAKCIRCLGTVRNLDGSEFHAIRKNMGPFALGNCRVIFDLLNKRFVWFPLKAALKTVLQKIKRSLSVIPVRRRK